MAALWKTLLVVFLVLNALFWGLASHSQHCSVASALGVSACPPHWLHLLTGVVSFIAAVVLQHKTYLFP
jgi:hypothetical protein